MTRFILGDRYEILPFDESGLERVPAICDEGFVIGNHVAALTGDRVASLGVTELLYVAPYTGFVARYELTD